MQNKTIINVYVLMNASSVCECQSFFFDTMIDKYQDLIKSCKINETVSVGDTAVILHTLGGGILDYSKLKCQDLTKFSLGRGYSCILDYSKLKVPRSDQIFIFGVGGILDYSNSKCHDLTNFSFSGGMGRGGGILDYTRIGHSSQNAQKFCHAKLWKVLHHR